MKRIEKRAFWGCSSLEKVSIPESVKNIGPEAFGWCIGLTEISISSKTKLSRDIFIHCNHNLKIDRF